jgi:hypothetical protein
MPPRSRRSMADEALLHPALRGALVAVNLLLLTWSASNALRSTGELKRLCCDGPLRQRAAATHAGHAMGLGMLVGASCCEGTGRGSARAPATVRVLRCAAQAGWCAWRARR